MNLTFDKKHAQYLPYHVTYAPLKFEVATSTSLGGNAFKKKIYYMTLTLGSRSHKMLPVFSTSRDICICVRFEDTMSNGLGEYAFTRNVIIVVNVA